MDVASFPPPPVFVASIQEFKQDLNGFYHECMGTIVTGLHLLSLCSCITVFDPIDMVFLTKSPLSFRAVAGTDVVSGDGGTWRNVTNIFAHRYCGGRPRGVDIGLVKLEYPWEPKPKFGVASLGIERDKSYYDYKRKTKHLSGYECMVYSWINRKSIEEEWKPYDENTKLEIRKTYTTQDFEQCYPTTIFIGDSNVTVNKPERADKLCARMSYSRGCGIDKGAPLICQRMTANDREIFVAGIGLGGSQCLEGVESFSIYQGFMDCLSFLRYYLALDEDLYTDLQSVEDRISIVENVFFN